MKKKANKPSTAFTATITQTTHKRARRPEPDIRGEKKKYKPIRDRG